MFDPFEVPDEFTSAAIAETDVETTGAASPVPGGPAGETTLDEVWDGLDDSDGMVLFEVGPEALEVLRAELEPAADAHAQRTDFLRIVRETLALETDEHAMVDLVEIIRSAIVTLLSQGDSTLATELAEMLRELRGRTRHRRRTRAGLSIARWPSRWKSWRCGPGSGTSTSQGAEPSMTCRNWWRHLHRPQSRLFARSSAAWRPPGPGGV